VCMVLHRVCTSSVSLSLTQLPASVVRSVQSGTVARAVLTVMNGPLFESRPCTKSPTIVDIILSDYKGI